MPTAVQRLVEVVKAEQQQYSFQMFLTHGYNVDIHLPAPW